MTLIRTCISLYSISTPCYNVLSLYTIDALEGIWNLFAGTCIHYLRYDLDF